jgi:hypothetical protein
VVLRFLESVGRRAEAEFYVQLFRSEPKEQFGAIAAFPPGALLPRLVADARGVEVVVGDSGIRVGRQVLAALRRHLKPETFVTSVGGDFK